MASGVSFADGDDGGARSRLGGDAARPSSTGKAAASSTVRLGLITHAAAYHPIDLTVKVFTPHSTTSFRRERRVPRVADQKNGLRSVGRAARGGLGRLAGAQCGVERGGGNRFLSTTNRGRPTGNRERMGHLRSFGVLLQRVVHLGRGSLTAVLGGGFTKNSSSLI